MRRHQDDRQRAETALNYGAPYVDADFDHHRVQSEALPLSRENHSDPP
jgi:hypothetical protein